MRKDELLTLITNDHGNTRISPLKSRENGEEIINLAKHLEHDGKIALMEYCVENKPYAVSLKANVIE